LKTETPYGQEVRPTKYGADSAQNERVCLKFWAGLQSLSAFYMFLTLTGRRYCICCYIKEEIMKQGDIFVVDEKESLFMADTITPSGAVYARKFDIYTGTQGGIEAFPAHTKFKVLFNSLGLSEGFSTVKVGSTSLKDFVVSRRKSFQALAAESKLKETLEDKMRPGAYSAGGFLGTTESLKSVIRHDKQILKELGITFENLASKLGEIIEATWQIERNHSEPREHARASNDWYVRARKQSFPLVLTSENLPSQDIGNLYDQYQVIFMAFRGFQDCPWDCQLDNNWSSFDFILLNRQSGEYVFAPGLIVHLIQKHHFFEGNESPYRVEPSKLARVLGLV